MTTTTNSRSATDVLGQEGQQLLQHECKTIPRGQLHLPGPDFVDRIFTASDRNNRVLGNLQWLFQHGRLEADIIKQKLPEGNGGFPAIGFGKHRPEMYEQLASDHPIDLTRYQVANCYMGRIGLINSGGSSGKDDLRAAVRTAVINKRAGGMGLISGRKAFGPPLAQGVELLHAIQDVYLDPAITIA